MGEAATANRPRHVQHTTRRWRPTGSPALLEAGSIPSRSRREFAVTPEEAALKRTARRACVDHRGSVPCIDAAVLRTYRYTSSSHMTDNHALLGGARAVPNNRCTRPSSYEHAVFWLSVTGNLPNPRPHLQQSACHHVIRLCVGTARRVVLYGLVLFPPVYWMTRSIWKAVPDWVYQEVHPNYSHHRPGYLDEWTLLWVTQNGLYLTNLLGVRRLAAGTVALFDESGVTDPLAAARPTSARPPNPFDRCFARGRDRRLHAFLIFNTVLNFAMAFFDPVYAYGVYNDPGEPNPNAGQHGWISFFEVWNESAGTRASIATLSPTHTCCAHRRCTPWVEPP